MLEKTKRFPPHGTYVTSSIPGIPNAVNRGCIGGEQWVATPTAFNVPTSGDLLTQSRSFPLRGGVVNVMSPSVIPPRLQRRYTPTVPTKEFL
jgi:hypothetical protein